MAKAQELIYAVVGAGDYAVDKVKNVRKVADQQGQPEAVPRLHQAWSHAFDEGQERSHDQEGRGADRAGSHQGRGRVQERDQGLRRQRGFVAEASCFAEVDDPRSRLPRRRPARPPRPRLPSPVVEQNTLSPPPRGGLGAFGPWGMVGRAEDVEQRAVTVTMTLRPPDDQHRRCVRASGLALPFVRRTRTPTSSPPRSGTGCGGRSSPRVRNSSC